MANIPEYNSTVMADNFQVRTITRSNEPELLFQSANTAAGIAQQAGRMYEQEMIARAEQKGASAVIYEQQPDGTQRLRPLEDLQAIDFGAGNQAFNRALLQQYSAAIGSEARQAYGGFQARYPNSPSEFNAAATAYNTELLNRMPANARGRINLELQQLSSQFAGGIAERQQRIAQEQIYQSAVRSATDLASDGDGRSASNPRDPEIPLIRERLRTHLENMRILHGDRVNEVTVRDALRGYDLVIEGNRVTQEAGEIYRRAGGGAAGRVAAQRYLDGYRRQPVVDTPGTPGGTWRPPQQSLIEPATPEDRRRAREIAGTGALRAEPNTRLNEAGRPILRNPDGSISTERSITVEDPRLNGGRITLIPSIQEGQQLSPRQAVAYAIRSGRSYPSFDNQTAADTYARERSRGLGQGQPPAPGAPGGGPAAAASGAMLPWTTQEREQVIGRANAWIGDQENRRNLALSERRQHEADVTHRALVEANRRRQYIDPQSTQAQGRVTADVMARFGPQLPTQSARDALELTLNTPVSTEIWRQQTERDRGRDAIQLLTALDANRAAGAAGQPFPYPLTQVTQAFPPHLWGAAAGQIIEQQNTAAAAQATLLRQQNTVNTAMAQPNATVPVPNAIAQPVYDQSYVNPQTGARSAPPLSVPAAREAATAMMRTARFISSQARDAMDTGIAPNATLQAAIDGDAVWSGLTSDQRTRPVMEGLIGTSMSRLQRNSRELARIMRPDNQRTHNPDGSLNQVAAQAEWQNVQARMQTAANMTDAQVTANIGRALGNTTNPNQAVQDLMRTTMAVSQPGGMGPDMRRFAGAVGAEGLAERAGMGTFELQVTTGLPGGTPFFFQDIPFIGSIENPMFGYPVFGGSMAMPVDIESTSWGAGKVFMEGVQEAVRMGVSSPEELGQAGHQYLRLRGYGPSYIATGRTDAAVIVQNPPEEEWRRQNIEPIRGISQIVGGAVAIENAYLAAGRESPFRYPGDHLRALQNKDIFLQVQQGQDGNPVYVMMAREPNGPGGIRGEVRALTWMPGLVGSRNLTQGANDSVVIQFQPDPQDAADIARRQELRTRATEYVTRVHPDVSTIARRMLIGLTEVNMEWGMHREDAGGRAIQPGSPVGTPRVDPDDPFSGRPPPQAAGPRLPPGTSPERRRSQQVEPQAAPAQPPPPPPPEPSPYADPLTGFQPRGAQGPPMSGPRR